MHTLQTPFTPPAAINAAEPAFSRPQTQCSVHHCFATWHLIQDDDRRRDSRRDERGSGRHGRGDDEDDLPVLDVELPIGEVDEEEEERRRLEESRRRRAEILAKHKAAAAVAAPTATAAADAAAAASGGATANGTDAAGGEVAEQPAGAAAGESVPPSPAPPQRDPAAGDATPEGDRESSGASGDWAGEPAMDIWNRGQGAGGAEADGGADEATSGRSASPGALTAPASEPNKESEQLRPAFAAAAAGAAAAAVAPAEEEAAAAADDMFAEEVPDDMFAEGGDGGAAGGGAGVRPAAVALADAYDDAEGYYNYTVGALWIPPACLSP